MFYGHFYQAALCSFGENMQTPDRKDLHAQKSKSIMVLS